MFTSDRILTLDIGASKVVLAEFSGAKSGSPQLLNYGIGRLGLEPESGEDASAYIVSTVRELMREHRIKPAPLVMTVSGQAVFPRYVKLPPVSKDKIAQIVHYEAEQNVPFPINEVVWDYQLMGDSEDGELNVMLAAVKIENVTQLTDCIQALGLEPDIVDVAPMALYNTVRYNYPDLDGCTMVLDIGARASNLIFIEGNRIFSRSIPVAGNAITNELMKEFDVPFAEAEGIKEEHAFVAFGGVYAGPDNKVADRVSKIVRNVVTRLHAEVNRSINFYRSQQGGSAPTLVLLAGGSSVIPHMDTFFREKLNVDVECLNPFANVAVSDQIDAEQVSSDVNMLGEVVGLALRKALQCPIEMNLLPPQLVAKKQFRRRQPVFISSAVGLILVMLCWGAYFYRMKAVLSHRSEIVNSRIGELKTTDKALRGVKKQKMAATDEIGQLADLVNRRTQWARVLEAVQSCMLDGMWLTSFAPVVDEGRVSSVIVEGMGFVDRLEAQESGEETAVELFRNGLRASEAFTDGTSIKQAPPLDAGAYSQKFTMLVELSSPIKLK